jgi:hypothetical protein
MRKSCRRPSLVGGKRCRQSQYLPPAGSTSRSRPPPSETRYRRDPCGRARTSLSVRAKTPFTPPLTPPQFFACLGFAGMSWDAQTAENPLQRSGSRESVGHYGKPWESPVWTLKRRGRDSNPRKLSLRWFSRPEPSTTRPPLPVPARSNQAGRQFKRRVAAIQPWGLARGSRHLSESQPAGPASLSSPPS